MKRRTRAIDGEALAAEIASLSKLVFANSANAGSHVRKSDVQGNRPARSDSRDRISPPGTGLRGTQASPPKVRIERNLQNSRLNRN
jgi:hypothetical protein